MACPSSAASAPSAPRRYHTVTAKMTPKWSSAKKIDVSKELAAAFKAVPPKFDKPMEPDKQVETPTLSPPRTLVDLIVGGIALIIILMKLIPLLSRAI